jgi:predicted RNA-binding protein with RPS1 domain
MQNYRIVAWSYEALADQVFCDTIDIGTDELYSLSINTLYMTLKKKKVEKKTETKKMASNDYFMAALTESDTMHKEAMRAAALKRQAQETDGTSPK